MSTSKNTLKAKKNTSEAKTRGVVVRVRSQYLSDRSQPPLRRFMFAYRVVISIERTETVQLRSRHWIITDGLGQTEEVKGPGVVGEEPVLRPGEHFEYTSGAVLRTERGTMHGSYQMQLADGSQFDATIAPFALERPFSLN